MKQHGRKESFPQKRRPKAHSSHSRIIANPLEIYESFDHRKDENQIQESSISQLHLHCEDSMRPSQSPKKKRKLTFSPQDSFEKKIGAKFDYDRNGRITSQSSLINRKLAPPPEQKFPHTRVVYQEDDSMVLEEAGRQLAADDLSGIMNYLKKPKLIQYQNSDEEEPLTPRGSHRKTVLSSKKSNRSTILAQIEVIDEPARTEVEESS